MHAKCTFKIYHIISVNFRPNLLHVHVSIFSFKDILRTVTCCTPNTIQFLQKYAVLRSGVVCPGPCVKGARSIGCGHQMLLKKTKDSKDQFIWRCHRLHRVTDGDRKLITKDVKLTIRHMSWLVDSKITLPTVVELMYLWAQGISVLEIMHELKVSKRTAVEWTVFFRECCFTN